MSRQNQRYAERLTKLRDYIAALPANRYNHDELVETLGKEPCGTVACAFGHAIANKNTLFPGLRPIKVSVSYPDQPWEEQGVHYNFPDLPNDKYADAEEWANYYFGPGSWSNVFSLTPYYDLKDQRPAAIKRAVVTRLGRLIREWETT